MKLNKRIIATAGAATLAAGAIMYSLLSSSRILDIRDYSNNLQAAIDAAATGDTIQLNGIVAICNCIDNKGVNIVGPGVIKTPNPDPAIFYPPKTPPASLKNLEVTTSSGQVYDIVRYGTWQQSNFDDQPQGLTLDNVYIHGQPGQEVQRGIAANGRNFSITNSRVVEIHGKGYDTQAICFWNGSGPFNISDNDLQASGEVILVGGADASIPNLVPSDITIRRNHVWKPLMWRGTWTAKNLIEVKNGRNVIIDGNVLENSWGDAQIGYGVLFTVRNQDGNNPWAIIENVAFTNNTMSNVAGGFQLLGLDYLHPSQQSSKLRIANNFIKIAPDGSMGPNGRLILVQQFNAVTFENNESDPPHSFALMSGRDASGAPYPVSGFIYRNNLVAYGQYGLFSESDVPYTTFAPDGIVTGNYIYGTNILASKKIANNTYLGAKPASVPAGVGVDYAALAAAQSNASPSPSASSSLPSLPTPSTASPNNTRVPSATQIIDDQGAIWTLSGIKMLRNGQDTGGFGSMLLWCSGKIYGLGEDNRWWLYNAPGWGLFGSDPCATASPSPSVVPSPTTAPTPLPSSTPAPSSTPLPFCASGQRPGNPPICRCRNGFLGNSGKCR